MAGLAARSVQYSSVLCGVMWCHVVSGEAWIKIPLVNPTFWLNHIFFTTPYHWRNNTVRAGGLQCCV